MRITTPVRARPTIAPRPRTARPPFAARSVRLGFAALAGIAASGQSVRADLTGFTDFAPINESIEGAASPAPGATTFNGYYGGSQFQVTSQLGTGQAVSGFANTKQTVTSFQANFTYLATYTGTPADGVTFTLQNDPRGTAALGGRGGSYGYVGITNSAATNMRLYSQDAVTEYVNGGVPSGFIFFPGGVSLRSQTPIDVTVSYYGNSLTHTYRQLSTGAVFSRTLSNVDLPAAVGGASAFVGFTGGTGGFTATQNITNFTFRNAAGAFTPIGVSGFNQDLIVEAGASSVPAAITATVDDGTNKTGATFYERGYNAAAPSTGLPTATPFTSTNDTQHSYALAPASANNGVLLTSATPTGTLTLDTPAAYSALSFLTTTGSGSGGFNATIRFAGGATETLSGIMSPDWFNAGGVALAANGRVYDDGGFDSVDGNNPRLYQSDVFLTNTAGLIESIDLQYAGGTGNTVIFGVSGISAAPVPEPGTAGVLAAAAGLVVLRRRRS